MKLKVEMTGYREAAAVLRQLPVGMQRQMFRRTLRRVMRPMLRAAQEKVPVRTGRLRKKLRVVSLRSGGRGETSLALKHAFDRTRKGAVNEFYGKFVHEGTEERKTRRAVVAGIDGKPVNLGTRRGRMMPNPYLEKAYREKEQQLISDFGKALAEEVGKYVSRKFRKIG